MTMKRLAAVGLVLLGLAGCNSNATSAGSVPPSQSQTQSLSPSPSSPSSASQSASGSPSSPGAVVLDEHANHTTVKVGVGATIRIDLHSTYWSPVASSAPQLVTAAGSSTSPAPSCRPGGGCGTLSTSFQAKAAGSAQLAAERTSCGEAMACPPDQRTFSVTVVVG